jgi:mono/diheme cytochrome c family protein
LKSICHYLALGAIFAVQTAAAADADNGKRLALLRCATCHIVVPNQRDEVADSPPFETIARKFGSDAELIAVTILSPHPRMNLTLTRREAEDIAAYISTLANSRRRLVAGCFKCGARHGSVGCRGEVLRR